MIIAVAVSTHKRNTYHKVLQDVFVQRLGLLKELSDMDIAIEVICRMYNSST